MEHASTKRWAEAARIAVAAMGPKACDDDPLAYVALTELIYAYGNRKTIKATG